MIRDVQRRMPEGEIPLYVGDVIVREKHGPADFLIVGRTSRGKVRLQNLNTGSVFTTWWRTRGSLPPWYRYDAAKTRSLRHPPGSTLEPTVLAALIRQHVEALIEDGNAWDEAIEREREGQKLLRQTSQRWEEIVDTLNNRPDEEDEDED